MIKVAAFFLADAATVREGLLNVLGAGVNVVVRPTFPAPLGVPLVAVLEVEPDDRTTHQIVVSVQADATPLVQVQVQLEGGASGPFADLPAYVPLVLPVGDARLPQPGRYEAALAIDDQLMSVVAFRAHQSQGAGEQRPQQPGVGTSPTDIPPFV